MGICRERISLDGNPEGILLLLRANFPSLKKRGPDNVQIKSNDIIELAREAIGFEGRSLFVVTVLSGLWRKFPVSIRRAIVDSVT
jgi:hypothetical protein